MLSKNEKKIAQLTETQRRILDIASSANAILHKDGKLQVNEND